MRRAAFPLPDPGAHRLSCSGVPRSGDGAAPGSDGRWTRPSRRQRTNDDVESILRQKTKKQKKNKKVLKSNYHCHQPVNHDICKIPGDQLTGRGGPTHIRRAKTRRAPAAHRSHRAIEHRLVCTPKANGETALRNPAAGGGPGAAGSCGR